jgi:hypothetical protein
MSQALGFEKLALGQHPLGALQKPSPEVTKVI